MTTQPQIGAPGTGAVRLLIPARAEYLRLARMTTAGLASLHGFDVEGVDELRMAVDEACHLLTGARWDDEGTIALEFRSEDDVFVVEGRASIAGSGGSAPEFSEQILASLTDDYDCSSNGSGTRVRFTRRLPAGEG